MPYEKIIVKSKKSGISTNKDGTLNFAALQNPPDPEATCRTKTGKDHCGYVTNLKETVGKNGSVVTNYVYEQNLHSASQFLKTSGTDGCTGKIITVVTDGAYGGTEDIALAKEKNVNLITTSLTGQETPDINLGVVCI